MAVYLASDKRREYAQEVSKKASMANKRLRRLENKDLTDNPAYKQWKTYNGGVNFSVAGKDYNELQKEMARIDQFINAKTSTIRGTNKVLKGIAENTGIQYNSVRELQQASKNFFELTSKIDQYLKNTQKSAHAIGYRKIWEVVNQYVKENDIVLSETEQPMESMLSDIVKLLDYEAIEKGYEGYSETGHGSYEWIKI